MRSGSDIYPLPIVLESRVSLPAYSLRFYRPGRQSRQRWPQAARSKSPRRTPITRISEKSLFDALAAVSRAFAEDGLPSLAEAEGRAINPSGAPSGTIEAMDPEVREALGEASLAVAYGAFASQDEAAGAMHMLVGAIGLLALHGGEDADPTMEIMAVLADDARVETEIDRAGEALDQELGRDAPADVLAAALEARIVGTAIMLAGCTLPAGLDGQVAVRARAARYLARLAVGLLAVNAVEAGEGRPLPQA